MEGVLGYGAASSDSDEEEGPSMDPIDVIAQARRAMAGGDGSSDGSSDEYAECAAVTGMVESMGALGLHPPPPPPPALPPGVPAAFVPPPPSAAGFTPPVPTKAGGALPPPVPAVAPPPLPAAASAERAKISFKIGAPAPPKPASPQQTAEEMDPEPELEHESEGHFAEAAPPPREAPAAAPPEEASWSIKQLKQAIEAGGGSWANLVEKAELVARVVSLRPEEAGWSIKQLKQAIEAGGGSWAGLVEKAELVARAVSIREAAAQPASAGPSPAGTSVSGGSGGRRHHGADRGAVPGSELPYLRVLSCPDKHWPPGSELRVPGGAAADGSGVVYIGRKAAEAGERAGHVVRDRELSSRHAQLGVHDHGNAGWTLWLVDAQVCCALQCLRCVRLLSLSTCVCDCAVCV